MRVGALTPLPSGQIQEWSVPMKPIGIVKTIFATSILLVGIASIDFAQAKKVGPVASGAAIETCLLSDDHRLLENSTHSACCSKDAGICVICPKPPSAGASCDVVPYRPSPIMSPRAMSPDTLNGLQRMSK
jgi:hypothetical protein